MWTMREEVTAALTSEMPVVALESTLIAHGLPWPTNLETAMAAEAVIRDAGAIPATIAVWHGVPTIGLSREQIEELAHAGTAVKASRRDLGAAIALKRLAATTVSATMALAHLAGIRVFATGGIGGAHRDMPGQPAPGEPFDVSADLTELSRTPVLVVCAGAKNLLDLPRTLELLETLGVPVVGYRCDTFPAFYVRETPLPVSVRVENAKVAAAVFDAHVRVGGCGAILAQPCPAEVALGTDEFETALAIATDDAHAAGITGARVTPYVLKRLAEVTAGRTLTANRALILENARLAAEVATELSRK